MKTNAKIAAGFVIAVACIIILFGGLGKTAVGEGALPENALPDLKSVETGLPQVKCSFVMANFGPVGYVELIIIVATIFAAISYFFNHPLIPMYLFGGLIIGPVLGCIEDTKTVMFMAELGIAFTLFVVGLEIDIDRLRKVGYFSIVAAFVQSIVLFFVGYFFIKFAMPVVNNLLNIENPLVFTEMELFYVGVGVMFSSTMLIIKILTDKEELNTLHGRTLLGILLVEDIIAVFILSLIGKSGEFAINMDIISIASSIITGVGLFLIAIVLGKFIFPPILRRVERSRELMFLTVLSICFTFMGIAQIVGYSIAIGAFIAGISIAPVSSHEGTSSKVRSLRDFFATIFFISIGMQISGDIFREQSIMAIVLPAVLLAALALTVKPIISFVLSSLYGYGKRSSFLTAIGLTQISEFALIIGAAGFTMKHITMNVFSIIIIFTALTLMISPYMIRYEKWIYDVIYRWLGMVGRISPKMKRLEEKVYKGMSDHAIICGGGRTGSKIVENLMKKGKKVVVVDYDPEVVASFIEKHIPAVYGDANETDLLEKRAELKSASMIIYTVEESEYGSNVYAVKAIKAVNKEALLIMTTADVDYAVELYNAGADYVILPKVLSSERITSVLGMALERPDEFMIEKTKHMHSVQLLEESRMRRE